jgi:hypothetical protein
MDNLQLENFVRNLVPLAEMKAGKQFLEVTVPAVALHNLGARLRDSKETLFDFLFCLSGVDFGQNLGVVYHLRSSELKHSIVLKVLCSDRVSPKPTCGLLLNFLKMKHLISLEYSLQITRIPAGFFSRTNQVFR